MKIIETHIVQVNRNLPGLGSPEVCIAKVYKGRVRESTNLSGFSEEVYVLDIENKLEVISRNQFENYKSNFEALN
jgi:hypothetical protein